MLRHANYSAGNTTSTPFFFRRITMNFAGSVVLAGLGSLIKSLSMTFAALSPRSLLSPLAHSGS